ncbi:hypothetical protein CAEBREN_05009 [Caenorhabditis brenneri]|uniref:F-box domain-containing protein n=1 Tax=Caenorhabditis brenneri TaxID=135651 RepID=G0MFT8_CAEBE|nr:hypothetical protein CAEBREN_05009 [Caenorhabditis brenneri]
MEELASVFQNKVSINSKPNFSDLPLELIEKIVKEADLPSRLVLRKVSKYLRELVKKQEPRYKSVGIVINSNCIQLDLEGVLINYTITKNRNCAVGIPGREPKQFYKENIYVMFDDLMTFMSNRSFYVEHLKITTTDDASYEMFTYLQRKFLRSKTVNSLWVKVNVNQSWKRVSNFIDRRKTQKFECHWLEEESSGWFTECKQVLVLDGDNYVGEESYVIVPKHIRFLQKAENDWQYANARRPENVVKWEVSWPKDRLI